MSDASTPSRLFPGYSTTELKAAIAGIADATLKAKMQGEISRREAGHSTPRVTPQVNAFTYMRPTILGR